MSLKDKVAIIGVGCTKFGENFNLDYKDMLVDSYTEAMEDAGIEPKDIDAAWLATAFPDMAHFEGNSGSSLAEPLNLYGRPITHVTNYCATGMDAVRNAAMAVASGNARFAYIGGVEKMRDVGPRESLIAQVVKTGHPVVGKGATAPGMFAMLETRYMAKYGVDRTPFAEVSVKNHANGSLNPKAHFGRPVTIEAVLNAPMIAYPLSLYECTPVSDGSASAIITTPEIAKSLKKDYILVKAMSLSIDAGYTPQFDKYNEFLGFKATQNAGVMAYKEAGIKNPHDEIDFAEVHDCFTITEVVNYEDLQFCRRGDGWKFVHEGRSSLQGELPVNPSGGLQSSGHPIGATGVRMVYELVTQLRGKAGKRQVKNARVGLAHNLGGPGSVASVAILARPD